MNIDQIKSEVRVKEKTYMINEIFYSLQGEGVRTGCPSIFVRFAGCNLNCKKDEVGFDCDTNWVGGDRLTAKQILNVIDDLKCRCDWIVFTGGEPTLQLDDALIGEFKRKEFNLAIETNGTKKVPMGIDWICVCPKRPDDQIFQRRANELKIVLRRDMKIPKYNIQADHYVISPAFEVPDRSIAETHNLPRVNLEWAIKTVLENPQWRLSVQDHKFWKVK